MENEETNGLLIFGGIGVLCGVFAAILSRHTKNPFAWTVFQAMVVVPTAVIVAPLEFWEPLRASSDSEFIPGGF